MVRRDENAQLGRAPYCVVLHPPGRNNEPTLVLKPLHKEPSRLRRAVLGTVHDDIVSQEEMRLLERDRERGMQLLEFCVSKRRVRISNVSVVDLHHDIHACAVGKMLPEEARIVFALLKLLYGHKLTYKRAIPYAASVCFPVQWN